ncbi:MAG: hypothetical protein HY517_00775 [Candidatus Aenigmarchaeota archaeon]|nr:hypothetical protein [Candidatus Aenigmarchaeota archaeon]
MKASLVFAISILALLASPVFAAATLTVNGTSQAPRYINSGDNVTMLNISLLAANSTINITSILINFSTTYATVEANNISAFVTNVSIYNDTDGDGIFNPSTDTTLFGSNITFGNETRVNSTNITLSPIQIGTSNLVRLLVVFRLNITAPVVANISANITGAASIGTNETVSGSFPMQSSFGETRDVHANVTLRPNYVDTNVTNQSIVYNFTITGVTSVNKTRITLPSGYILVNVTNVTLNGLARSIDICPVSVDVCTVAGSTEVNLTYPTPLAKGANVSVTMSVNTSLSALARHDINSTLYSSDLTLYNISTSVVDRSTNITTQPIINGSTILITKGAAILNGSDYWEFNFTLNFSATVPGIIQFKMYNWSDGVNNISLANASESEFYATMRNEVNFSTTGKFNVLNRYNGTVGLYHNASTASTTKVILRMVIPSGTTAISSNWFTIYNFLFRAIP